MTNNTAENIYDVIIVGAGAAGLSAAIYTGRKLLKTLVASKDVGGQAGLPDRVENYPGLEPLAGFDLMEKFKKQAQTFGADFKNIEIIKIEKTEQAGRLFFQLASAVGEFFLARAVILAFGLMPRELGVKGEEKFKGRGVAFCATCDAPLYRNKIAAVVGGGNSGLEATLQLAKIAKKIYLIHCNQGLLGEQTLIEQVKKLANVEFIFNAKITEIIGDNKVQSIIVQEKNKEPQEIALDGVFVEIGWRARTDWLKGVVDLNDKQEVVVSKDGETSQKGIFAAGDVTDITFKQIIIAAGEGAKAALAVARYLQSA